VVKRGNLEFEVTDASADIYRDRSRFTELAAVSISPSPARNTLDGALLALASTGNGNEPEKQATAAATNKNVPAAEEQR